MTFKEYLNFHHVKITGSDKPNKSGKDSVSIVKHHGNATQTIIYSYETFKKGTELLSEKEIKRIMVLSCYLKEHVFGNIISKKDVYEELNNTLSLRHYKCLLKELEVNDPIEKFKKGITYVVKEISKNREKEINNRNYKKFIKDYSGKTLEK